MIRADDTILDFFFAKPDNDIFFWRVVCMTMMYIHYRKYSMIYNFAVVVVVVVPDLIKTFYFFFLVSKNTTI